MDSVIKVTDVSLSRGGERLLSDISWSVSRGEHWAVLGANGAGKTLLMRLLTGYIWPTEGTVDILGQRLGRVDLRALRSWLGWVSRSLEEMTPGYATAREVVLSGYYGSLGLYETPSDLEEGAADKLGDEFGLGRVWGRRFDLLSSGEKQRALLARAVIAQPALILLDEPLANLDMAAREQNLALLNRLAAGEGAPTIVLTTHNTLEIGPFMTHGLFMRRGRVIAAGPLGEVMRPDTLEMAFDLPLKVEKTAAGRYLAYL